MVTLTLRPGVDWEPSMIRSYIACVRAWAGRRGYDLPYLWVAELQASRLRRIGTKVASVVHYHVIFRVPKGLHMPKADVIGWWPHGMTKTEVAYKPVGYLAKYVSKCDEQDFPKGIRLFGIGGLDHAARDFRRWWCAPLYVRGQAGPGDRPMRDSGGYLSRVTGEFLITPYEIKLKRGPLGERQVWVAMVGDPSEVEIAAMNDAWTEASRTFAREARFTWLERPEHCLNAVPA